MYYVTGYIWYRYHILFGDKMATIKDVAKYAGVSVATVSRYLNQGYISEKARMQVEDAIKELGYRPSIIARSLNTKQTNAIGLIIPDITNPFFPELARAVEDAAYENGYTVILCNTDEQAEKERQYIETLTRKYIAGIILATNELDKEYYKSLNVPLVALDRSIGEGFPTVMTQNIEGAKLGSEFLLRQQIHHLVCLRGPDGLKPADDRLKGFLQATENSQIKTTIIECPFDYNEAEQIVFKLLKEDSSIDAIFACSDVSAIGALKAAHSLKITVPDQLQILGFDGIMLGQMTTPGLSTVAQNIYELGSKATKLLIKQIDGELLEQMTEFVAPQLTIRDSTKGVIQ